MDETSVESFLKLKNKIMYTSSLINLYETSKYECKEKEQKVANVSLEYSKLMEKHKTLLIDYLEIEKIEKDASLKLKYITSENKDLIEKNNAHEAYKIQLEELIASHEKSINKHTKEISALTISHKKELLSLQDSLIKSSLRIKKLSNEKDHLIHLVQYFGEKAKKSNILTGSDKRIYKRFLKSHSAAIGTTIKKDCPVDKNEENLLNLNEPLSCISEDTGRGSSICTSDDEKYISNNATPERQQSPIYEDLPHLDAEVFTQTKKVDNTCNSLMEEDNCSDSKIEKILNNVRSNLPKIVSPIPSSAPIESVNTTSLNTSKSFQNVTLFTEYFSNIARQIFKEEMIKFSKNSKSMEEELESMVSENVQNPQNIQPQLTIQENCSNFTDSTNILKKIVNYASHMVEIEKSLTYPNGPISPTTNVDKIQEQSVVTKDQFTPDTVSQMDVCEDNINESALIINEFEIEHLQKEDPNFMSTTNCEIVLKSNPEPKVDETSSNISLDDIDSQKIKFLSLNNSKKFKRSEKFHELFNDDEEFSNPKISEVIIESPKTQSNLIRKSPRLHHKAVDTNISENILTDHSKFAVIAPLNSKSSVKTSNRVSTRKKTDLRPIRKSTRNAILSRTIVDSTKDCSYIAKRKSDSESQNIPSKIPKNKDSIINEPTNEEKLNRAKLIMSKLEEKKVPEKTTFLRKKIVQKQKQEISEPKITVDESIFESSTTKNDEEENDLPKNENHEREIVTYEDVLNCNSDTSICFLERLYMKYENQLSVKIKQHKSQNSLDPDIVEALEENLIDYFTSETLDNLYKILSNKKEKKIAAAMVNYLEKQRTENLGEVFLNSTPGISAYHYRLLACLNRFYKSPPPSFKYDLYSLIMDGIQYKCFTLDNTPSLQAIRSMSIFYAILCRITKQKEKLKVFCMDAIYCLSFKASPTIFNILKLWPQILPKAKSFAAQDPIVTVIVHSLLTHFSQMPEYNASKIKGLLLHNYDFCVGEYNDDQIINNLMDKLNSTKNGVESACIESAFTLLGKRLGVNETYKKLINARLLPLIDNETTSIDTKCATIRLIGILSRPFPPSMSTQCQGLMKRIFTKIDNKELPIIQESAVKSLCYFKKDSLKNCIDLLKTWKPNFTVSIETENTLKQILFQKNKHYWKKMLK